MNSTVLISFYNCCTEPSFSTPNWTEQVSTLSVCLIGVLWQADSTSLKKSWIKRKLILLHCCHQQNHFNYLHETLKNPRWNKVRVLMGKRQVQQSGDLLRHEVDVTLKWRSCFKMRILWITVCTIFLSYTYLQISRKINTNSSEINELLLKWKTSPISWLYQP